MDDSTRPSLLFPILRSILLIELALFVVSGIISWLVGWRTAYEYGNALTYAGTAVLLVAVVGGLGSVPAAGRDMKAFTITRAASAHRYLDSLFADNDRRLRSRLVLLAVGALAIAGGFVLQQFA